MGGVKTNFILIFVKILNSTLMKKRAFFYYLLMMFGLICITSCSSDDDEATNLKVPKYEKISAKYNAIEDNAAIKSLELTASGNYIVIKNSGRYYSAADRTAEKHYIFNNIFKNNSIATRAGSYNNIIYGKFTKIEENKYKLEGYGIVTISKSNDGVQTLDIALDNGDVMSIGARKEEQYKSSKATDNLCRTWKIKKFGIEFNYGKEKFEKTVDHNNMHELGEELAKWTAEIAGVEISKKDIIEAGESFAEEYNEKKPLSVIFTKSGSYMVDYNNGSLGIAIWKWENEGKGILRYSWNVDNINDQDDGGLCNISYSGNMLNITESFKTKGLDMNVTYIMTEQK